MPSSVVSRYILNAMNDKQGGNDSPVKDSSWAQPFIIVGIGASAGGLEAAKQFFRTVPADSGMAFVLIQHLDPTHDSMMSDLIGRFTEMPVRQVEEGVLVEPDCVYIIPPNRSLTLDGDRLHLQEFEQRRGLRAPIDGFLTSLAEQRGERAVGIILSGTASDGTKGLKQIKAHGGLTIAQEPSEAQQDGMPRSAINSGAVDYILPTEKMAETLGKYAEHPYVTRARGGADPERDDGAPGLDGILAVLRVHVRHDFRGYKKSTLLRRIERRMSLYDIRDMDQYRELLRGNPAEVKELLQDLLIGVTSFFREEEAWELLREEVLRPLVRQCDAENALRVWVPGCSTGKEPYTLAMLLLEEAEAAKRPLHAQVFATDIDLNALDKARDGIYPADTAEEVSEKRLKRFFDKHEHTYQVCKEVRELVTFAAQNLVTDPPFSNMDLICCRNLLIYLEADVQQRLVDVFHFALRHGGHLFLGNSESVNRRTDIFKTVSRKWRIYQKVGQSKPGTVTMPLVGTPAARRAAESSETTLRLPQVRSSPAQITDKALANCFVPAAVLVDSHCNIAYFHGKTEEFLTYPQGEPTRDLLALVRKGLRSRLRAAVNEAHKRGTTVSLRAQMLGDETAQPTRITVCTAAEDGFFIVAFSKEGDPFDITDEWSGSEEAVVKTLEDELKSAREELQNTVEELETSNEELKASNEETMSMNEELQSTNEELETSKEELQSVNEELTTVNAQLQEKVEELENANNDLDNLLNSTDIATLFLDPALRLKRYTPASTDLFRFIPSDIGRPIDDLTSKVSSEDLATDAQTVLRDLQPVTREVQSNEGRWFVRRTLPYRTQRNTVEGVVITFADVTDLKQAQRDEQQRREELEALMESVPAAVWIAHDPDCARITANRQGYEMLRLRPGANASKSAPQEERPSHFRVMKYERELEPSELPMQRAAATGKPVLDYEFDIVFEGGGVVHVLGNAVPLLGPEGDSRGAIAAFIDVTTLKMTQSQLEQLTMALEDKVEQRTAEVQRQAHRLQRLTWDLSTAEQRERRRLAKVLHDHLQQLLVAAKLQLGFADNACGNGECAQAREQVKELLGESITATRDLTLELSPPVLYDSGLTAALEWFGSRLEMQHGFHVEVESEVREKRMREHHRVLLFDCIRELVLNAVKHSGEDHARVALREVDAEMVEVVVEDDGQGFDVEALESERSGSHFGLFHIRQRLESVGGSIEARSTPGDGASFTLLCPAGAPVEKLPELISRGGGQGDGRIRAANDPIRILLADDHRIVRQSLRAVLEGEADLEIVGEASDGQEAIELAERLDPDVILMDINMPNLSGLDATRRIDERQPDICIIGLSVHEEAGMAKSMIEAGAVAYFHKDADIGELAEAIRTALDNPAATTDGSESA
jgi:two-component system CheB/CheR fusion protein